jgi:hypothetical protein
MVHEGFRFGSFLVLMSRGTPDWNAVTEQVSLDSRNYMSWAIIGFFKLTGCRGGNRLDF